MLWVENYARAVGGGENPTGFPTKIHCDEGLARKEAERLAVNEAGRVYLFKAVSVCIPPKQPKPVWHSLNEECLNDEYAAAKPPAQEAQGSYTKAPGAMGTGPAGFALGGSMRVDANQNTKHT